MKAGFSASFVEKLRMAEEKWGNGTIENSLTTEGTEAPGGSVFQPPYSLCSLWSTYFYAVAPNLTDTSFDTPGSCMVTPYSTGAMLMVFLLWVMSTNWV